MAFELATLRAGAGLVVCFALAAWSPSPKAQVFELGADGQLTRADAPQAKASPACARSGKVSSLHTVIAEAADRYALSADLVASIARQESGFRQDAVSTKGARGVMQLMPATAHSLGVNADVLRENIMGGAAYLRQMLDRFDGDLERAIAAYNAGPGAVDRFGGAPPYRETQRYLTANLDHLADASLKKPPLICLEGTMP